MTLREQLQRDEGLRLTPYRCPTGHLTIGYGHNLEHGISPRMAEMLLDEDLSNAMHGVIDRLDWAVELGPERFSVLVNMAFQMGVQGLLGFTQMLKCAQAGDYAGAAREMRESQWATQTPERAERLARQMEIGVWT